MMFFQDISLLQILTLPGSTTAALTFLDRISWYATLKDTKKHFFPNHADYFYEWNALDEFKPTAWELNLYKLVNEELFPIPDSMLEGEEIFERIQVWPYFPNWYDSELDDLPKSFQLVLHLLRGAFDPYGECEWLENIEVPDEETQLNTEYLNDLCTEFGQPLTVLPTVIEIIDGETGNVWLDAQSENCLEFDWTIENLEFLAEHWQGALNIAHQIDDLDKWLEHSKNIAIFLDIWRAANQIEIPKEPQALILSLQDLYDDSAPSFT